MPGVAPDLLHQRWVSTEITLCVNVLQGLWCSTDPTGRQEALCRSETHNRGGRAEEEKLQQVRRVPQTTSTHRFQDCPRRLKRRSYTLSLARRFPFPVRSCDSGFTENWRGAGISAPCFRLVVYIVSCLEKRRLPSIHRLSVNMTAAATMKQKKLITSAQQLQAVGELPRCDQQQKGSG